MYYMVFLCLPYPLVPTCNSYATVWPKPPAVDMACMVACLLTASLQGLPPEPLEQRLTLHQPVGDDQGWVLEHRGTLEEVELEGSGPFQLKAGADHTLQLASPEGAVAASSLLSRTWLWDAEREDNAIFFQESQELVYLKALQMQFDTTFAKVPLPGREGKICVYALRRPRAGARCFWTRRHIQWALDMESYSYKGQTMTCKWVNDLWLRWAKLLRDTSACQPHGQGKVQEERLPCIARCISG